jgi:ATP-binding cassette subfamily C (CFTR/MRP) protein 1
VIILSSEQRFFIGTSRELRRLESISEAPIIHHFSETVVGLAMIRAFDQQARYIGDL